MEIKQVTTINEFDKLTESWRTLDVWTFGPLAELEDDEEVVVTVGIVDDEVVTYLIADCEGHYLWHIETKQGHNGNGYAKILVIDADVQMAYEVCSDAGAAFCDALNIDFDDAREIF